MKTPSIKGYDVRDRIACRKCKSFVPFSGNGRKICRLYELGQCPPQEKNRENHSDKGLSFLHLSAER